VRYIGAAGSKAETLAGRVHRIGTKARRQVVRVATAWQFQFGTTFVKLMRPQEEAPADLGRLPDATEISLFRVVQEGLANIHRHAHTRTSVRMHIKDDKLTLEDIDQGRGASPKFVEGIGIKGKLPLARQ